MVIVVVLYTYSLPWYSAQPANWTCDNILVTTLTFSSQTSPLGPQKDKNNTIDWYGNFHLTDTDTDMLTMTDADTDTDKKKTNSPIPIKRKWIYRYRCQFWYEKLLDTDTDTVIFWLHCFKWRSETTYFEWKHSCIPINYWIWNLYLLL